jgi:hypothetical protein
MSAIAMVSQAANCPIEYFTDIEGNWQYFNELVDASAIVNRTSSGNGYELAPNTLFVHGGDTVDKGPGDIRIVKALTSLKKQYPDRVFLILGNRDVNKLRFSSELAEGETGSATDVYWDKKHMPYDAWLKEKGEEAGTISTCKWMLDKTMGSATVFETRKQELALLAAASEGKKDKAVISDEDVAQSFVESVNPSSSDPWMLEFLKLGQLALIIGDSIFVHG